LKGLGKKATFLRSAATQAKAALVPSTADLEEMMNMNGNEQKIPNQTFPAKMPKKMS
jgi:hypothetical protein